MTSRSQPGYDASGASADVEPSAAFGDVVENGWASEDNPTRRGLFVRSFTRKGRMNPGLTWEITDGKGKFWELQPRVIAERLTVTPATDPDLCGALRNATAALAYVVEAGSSGLDANELNGLRCYLDQCRAALAKVSPPFVIGGE